VTPETIAQLTAALRYRGEQTRIGEPMKIPEVPEDSLLALRPGEWGVRPGILETDRWTDIRTVRIYQARQAPGFIVVGHMVECAWPSIEPHPPCYEIYLTTDGLARAAVRLRDLPTRAPEADR
jgi:hypothetical protein